MCRCICSNCDGVRLRHSVLLHRPARQHASASDASTCILHCAGHVYRGGLKASGGTGLNTPQPASAQEEGSKAGSSAGALHEVTATSPAAHQMSAKGLIRPAALKVMDSGGLLPGTRDTGPVPNCWWPYQALPQLLWKQLCNTELVGFGCSRRRRERIPEGGSHDAAAGRLPPGGRRTAAQHRVLMVAWAVLGRRRARHACHAAC